jgi:hypothetical protein
MPVNSDDEALRLEVLKRRLAGTVRDALKSDDEIAAEVRGELLARAELRGRARELSSAAATPALAAAQAPTQPTASPTQPAAQPPRMLKRGALIAELERQWPSIERDISEASRNGLGVAHIGKLWDAGAALKWADSMGRLRTSIAARSGLTELPFTRHKLRD